jgi:hypothetical protein
MEANEPVALCSTNNPSEAELLKTLLEGAGVKCELDGANQGGLAGVLDIRVLVRAWDAERARTVLDSHAPGHKEKVWPPREPPRPYKGRSGGCRRRVAPPVGRFPGGTP